MNLLRRRFKIAHLIAEEFAGVITKENQARLEQWRVESPAHDLLMQKNMMRFGHIS